MLQILAQIEQQKSFTRPFLEETGKKRKVPADCW